jgi:hypothetical protein
MSYYSPYSQWPAGFLIAIKDYIVQQIRFSAYSVSPKDTVIQAIRFSNLVNMDIHVDGGKQSDDARPYSTTIIS